MRLLLDANLSYKITNKLKFFFEDCFHVDYIGLPVPSKDIEIWNYAEQNKLTIVTNDEDFLNFSDVKGFPPKVILLRTGNQKTAYVTQILIAHTEEIKAFNNDASLGVLELY